MYNRRRLRLGCSHMRLFSRFFFNSREGLCAKISTCRFEHTLYEIINDTVEIEIFLKESIYDYKFIEQKQWRFYNCQTDHVSCNHIQRWSFTYISYPAGHKPWLNVLWTFSQMKKLVERPVQSCFKRTANVQFNLSAK